MPQFSDNDINEAKRRVWEMRNKASRFVENNEDNLNKTDKVEEDLKKAKQKKENLYGTNSILSLLSSGGNGDSSSLIILLLILILSKEKADNTLIFALLYLLL